MAVQNITPIDALSSSIIAQSALAQSPAAAGLDLSSEIIVCTYSDIAEYQGTRAALEAEGVIPAGTKWPEGFDDLRWEDEKFSYWIRRERPEGIKGPRKQFIELDWWMFRCNPINAKPIDARIVERKAKELAEAIYRQSPEGRANWNKQWNAYWESQRDDRYQVFKAIIPGINRPKRGRRPKKDERYQHPSA
jgi:hypothetical protein